VRIPDWRREISGKSPSWNRYTNAFSKILEELQAVDGNYCIQDNSFQWRSTQTDTRGFCEDSGLGNENIRKNSWLHKGNIFLAIERVWSVRAGKITGTFLQCILVCRELTSFVLYLADAWPGYSVHTKRNNDLYTCIHIILLAFPFSRLTEKMKGKHT